MRPGGCAQTTGSGFDSSQPDHYPCVDGQIRGDIEQVLASMVNIALGPVFHSLIDFFEHLPNGHRQHQIAQHRHKKGRDVYQKQPCRFVHLPALFAFALVQHAGGHGQLPGIGKHVPELHRAQVMRCADGQRGCGKGQMLGPASDLLHKQRPYIQGGEAGEKPGIRRIQQAMLQLIGEYLQ